MSSNKTINDNLKHLNIDNQKTEIDKQVKNCNYWIFEHFLLPQGEQEKILPAFCRLIG